MAETATTTPTLIERNMKVIAMLNYQPMNPTWLERIKDGVTIPKVIISF